MNFVYFNLMMILFMSSLIFFLLFFIMLLNFSMISCELNLMTINSININIQLIFDYKCLLFCSVVLLISSMIILYSSEYMGIQITTYFVMILFLFVLSMIFMIIGQNLLMILLGWDGLGLISYLLVIYYNSWSSFNSGMLTILTNRLGDVGILMSIGLMSMEGSWNYMFFFNKMENLILFMMLIAGLTKSAQIPFSSWLPAAMAAPTPISSLVHSSTLVTAGIYLFLRIFHLLSFSMNFILIMFTLGLLTMLMASIIAVMENDLKKIIALSTLSQLGLMMVSLMLLMKTLCFFHLISHAMFKSLLFMCAGILLHFMVNNQDSRNLGSLSFLFYTSMVMFSCSSISLCGLPFMAGFYSKDLILEMMIMGKGKIIYLIIFYFSIMLTVIYSFRLVNYVLMSPNFQPMLQTIDESKMLTSMFILFLLSIFGGSMFSWLVFNSIQLVIINKSFYMILWLMILFSFVILFMKLSFKPNYINFFKVFNTMLGIIPMIKFISTKLLILSMDLFLLIEKSLFQMSSNFVLLSIMNLMKIEYSMNLILGNLMFMLFLGLVL